MVFPLRGRGWKIVRRGYEVKRDWKVTDQRHETRLKRWILQRFKMCYKGIQKPSLLTRWKLANWKSLPSLSKSVITEGDVIVSTSLSRFIIVSILFRFSKRSEFQNICLISVSRVLNNALRIHLDSKNYLNRKISLFRFLWKKEKKEGGRARYS